MKSFIFEITDQLDDTKFDYPVTVNVLVDDTRADVTAAQGASNMLCDAKLVKNGRNATIVINGGDITAVGSRAVAGIGSSACNLSPGSDITINGGTVIASSGNNKGAAIGFGSPDSVPTESGVGRILITGGDITCNTTGANSIGIDISATLPATLWFRWNRLSYCRARI